MGIDYQSLRFIQSAAPLGDVLTLGHQEIMVSDRRLKRMGLPCGWKYADELIESLGADSVTALDKSEFEGAVHVYDLNQPLNVHRVVDTIIDGGTLEHVFNLPQALANIMSLLKLNGRLIIDTPTNNWCGHGFYQFSPELFFSVLNRSNGFEIERMVIHRIGSSKWYEVLNPLETGRRTELRSMWPMNLKVMARRVELIEPFSNGYPQQSDYVKRWAKAEQPQRNQQSHPWWRPIATVLAFTRMGLGNKRCFRRL